MRAVLCVFAAAALAALAAATGSCDTAHLYYTGGSGCGGNAWLLNEGSCYNCPSTVTSNGNTVSAATCMYDVSTYQVLLYSDTGCQTQVWSLGLPGCGQCSNGWNGATVTLFGDTINSEEVPDTSKRSGATVKELKVVPGVNATVAFSTPVLKKK